MSIATVNARASAACARVASRRADVPRSAPVDIFGTRRPSRASVARRASAASAVVDTAFADAASGEWEGHRVYFDAAGVPQPLPDRVMPPAFSEWGQVLVDWQSQCAMNVTPEDGIYARELRFLPTAGCEADSSTVETAYERTVPPDVIDPAPTDAGPALGSYSAGANLVGADPVVVEHCLGFDDPADAGEDSNRRARVRVQQTLRPSDDADGAFVLDAIVAWKEYYYEPFNNAASLCASCGGPNKWGEYPAKDRDEFTGEEWTGEESDDTWGGFEGADVCMLPTGVWSATRAGSDGGITLEAGWLIPDRDAAYLPPKRDVETHLVSRRTYDAEGKLADVAFFKRTRTPKA